MHSSRVSTACLDGQYQMSVPVGVPSFQRCTPPGGCTLPGVYLPQGCIVPGGVPSRKLGPGIPTPPEGNWDQAYTPLQKGTGTRNTHPSRRDLAPGIPTPRRELAPGIHIPFGQTHAYENITFSHFHWRAVIMISEFSKVAKCLRVSGNIPK